jgi:hypothetical protein
MMLIITFQKYLYAVVTVSVNITICIISQNAEYHYTHGTCSAIVSRSVTAGDLLKALFHHGPMKMVLRPEQLLCHVATGARLLAIQPLAAL